MALSYFQARRGYLTWYELFLSPLTREEGESLLELLERRSEGFSFASEELTAATKPYLRSERHSERIAAVDSLLHQIEGDLEIANTLWNVISTLAKEPKAEFDNLLPPLVKNTRIESTYNRVRGQIPARIEQTARYYQGVVYQMPLLRPTSVEEAVTDLLYEIDDTLRVINERACSVTLRLAQYLILHGKTNWDSVLAGIELLRGTQKAGNIGWGFEDKVRSEMTVLAGTLRDILINMVEKILLVVEKNDLVRYVIADWLDDIKETNAEETHHIIETHIHQLYQTDIFRNIELPVWLKDATDVARIHECADHILKLGDNYERLSLQLKRLGILISANPLFHHPLLQSAGFAVQVGLMGTLVFAGYDHLDEGSRALNITEGIREFLINHLPVSAETLQLAENIKSNTIRESILPA